MTLMPDAPMSEAAENMPRPERERRRGHYWSGLAEERIQEAQRNGEFANLRGEGEPLPARHNVYAGDRALAYDLLASNQMAPPEIERGKEIDAELRRAEYLVATLRHRRAALGIGTRHASASERRAYNLLRDNTVARYESILRAVNSRILSLNIVAPAALHRRPIAVEAKLRALAEEFPRVGE
jgi:hypothetical protein